MKNMKIIYALVVVMMSVSCIVVYDHGPDGLDGEAFFGLDYHFSAPYSYWDDNPYIPYDPVLSQFYWTEPGTYDFEYFVNEYDYWHGTYSIWIEQGTSGGPYNEPGIDGIDTYLMLFCDPNGWHEDRFEYKDAQLYRDKDELVIESNSNGRKFKLEMSSSNTLERPTRKSPKWNSIQK